MFESIDDLLARLLKHHYFVDRDLATAIFLGSRLGKPVLIEGEPGTGKSDLARALAEVAATVQFTLQCYAGIDQASALADRGVGNAELVKRPLLAALTHPGERPAILLIDDVDRVDDEFAADLFEMLRERRDILPGTGAISALRPPLTILTADLPGRAPAVLRQVALYQRVSYPAFEREYAIVIGRVPLLSRALAGQLCNFVARMRRQGYVRSPGVGETIDWARALAALHRTLLDPETIDQTLGCVLKEPADISRFRQHPLSPNPRPLLDRVG